MRPLLLALALCGLCAAQPPKRAVPLEVSGDTAVVVRSFPCKVTAPPGADLYFWSFPDAVKAVAADNVLTVTAAPKGEHRISVVTLTIRIDFDLKKSEKAKGAGDTLLLVGEAPAPAPPGPGPTPAPDGPLRVLIVYESADLAKMPERQQQVIYGRKVRDWLNAKCAPDGDRRGWRIWDKDTDAAADAKHWQEYLKRPRAALPFLHVFRGDRPVHEGPLPDDPDAAVMLLERIEGGK